VSGADVVVRPARADEADLLTGLALRSKAHWGYHEDFMAACRDELTVPATACESGHVLVGELVGEVYGEVAGGVLGFSRIEPAGDVVELVALFVEPSAIGSGLGRLLMDAAVDQAKALGAARIELDADPYAEPFYARMGCVPIGESPSHSIPGRSLPRMALDF
jgi:GNAT superfamily N-acetyltransferase